MALRLKSNVVCRSVLRGPRPQTAPAIAALRRAGDGYDAFREARQATHAGNQVVVHATDLQFSDHR